MQRQPTFLSNGGTISILAHSLGSVMTYDLLHETCAALGVKHNEPSLSGVPRSVELKERDDSVVFTAGLLSPESSLRSDQPSQAEFDNPGQYVMSRFTFLCNEHFCVSGLLPSLPPSVTTSPLMLMPLSFPFLSLSLFSSPFLPSLSPTSLCASPSLWAAYIATQTVPNCHMIKYCWVGHGLYNTVYQTVSFFLVKLGFQTSEQLYTQSHHKQTLCCQRREDMTSCRSDNLHALITFQEQEMRMQVTRMALWKSQRALGVFY